MASKKYNKEIINNREWLKKKLEKKFECYAFNSTNC